MLIAAMSVMQPWANLIAIGEKAIEYRAASRSYRGPLLVHASKKAARYDWAEELDYDADVWVTGCAICIVRMVDCIWYPRKSRWGWVLEKPVLINPFAMKGNVGIFATNVPTRVFNRLSRSLRDEMVSAEGSLPRARAVGQ